MGDFNAKSSAYGCKHDNSNGSILENILCNNDCIIIESNDHTYYNYRNDKV